MRIFVIEPLGQGGLIHYSYHMCRALQRNGADVTLVTSTDYELEDLEHDFTVMRFMRLWNARQKTEMPWLLRKGRRVTRGVRYTAEWMRVVNLLREEKPDIILFGEVRFSYEKFFLKMLKRSGLVLADIVHDVRAYDTSRDSDDILKEDEAHIRQFNDIYGHFDLLFVHDRINYDLFLDLYDIPAERVNEIPHGANEIMLEMTPSHTPAELRAEYKIEPDTPIVLFFGTLTKYKGIEDLINAFPKVARETGAKLVIAGYPAKDIDPDELKATAKELGIEHDIVWYLDYVPNDQVVPLMQMSDIIALPYRAITQSGILQIAYACGKPVVATRVGGLGDAIEQGKSGLLTEPQNLEAFADALIELLNDDSLRQQMSDRALELAESKYSWRSVAKRVMTAMEKTIS
ncbi:MAG: hypothetical protein Phog2KO_25000 [Phototrophicaceae bacterium]